MNKKDYNVNFDDENLLLYYMNLCYKYEDILTEIKNIMERADIEWGDSNYEYIMKLINNCDLENY